MGEGALTSAAARRHIIKRPRLTRLLDETTARIILLVAPAGYGKTTLARQWLEDKPHLWYQARSSSIDPAALASGLVSEVARSGLSVGRDVGRALAMVTPPDTSALADLVLSDLAELPPEVVLAIDDAHLLDGSPSETLLEHFSQRTKNRFLITSRIRPTWATARRILYGEVQELGRNALALSHEEGRRILTDRGSAEVAGLMALSDGWPAVIGLAAHMRDSRTVSAELPSALHDYFAEELFQGATRRVQEALCELSISPRVDPDVLGHLFGNRSATVVETGRRLGFLSSETDGSLSLHPLLRSYLERKLDDLGQAHVHQVALDCVAFFLERREWDAAYTVLKRHRLAEALPELLLCATDDLLQSGRIGTLSEWASPDALRENGSELELVRAEVSFRKGSYLAAEAGAKRAATTFANGHPWRSRAWFRAGQAAYFRDNVRRALQYFSRAREAATNAAEVKAALWGTFHATVDDETDRARETLNLIAELDREDQYDELRYVNGLVALAVRAGPLRDTVLEVEGALGLLESIDDPVIRTSFLNSATHIFLLAGQFRRALALADSQLAEAQRFGLSFVLPHAIYRKSMAETALGDFQAARMTLDSSTDEFEDPYSRVIVEGARVRLAIASRAPGPLDILPDSLASKASRATFAEYVGTLALWHACRGELHMAAEKVARSIEASSSLEPRMFAASTAAVLRLASGRPHARSVARLARLTLASDCWEPVLCAIRGHHALLRALLEAEVEICPPLQRIATEAEDAALARDLGIRLDLGVESLTTREREVHALLGEGLTNKEIARRLYITESTAKVHVRRVMEKLGAQTRTAAALRFARER